MSGDPPNPPEPLASWKCGFEGALCSAGIAAGSERVHPGVQDPADVPRSGQGIDGGSLAGASGKTVRIVFFGDSITAGGVKSGGYVDLIDTSLHYLYPGWDIKVMGTGVVGDRVPQLLARFRKDVLSKKPTHVVVYIGVNDVGRPAAGSGNTGLSRYRKDLEDLMRRIQTAGAVPIVCTPAVIGEDPLTPTKENLLLDKYSTISREVAADFGARVCDLRAAFTGYLGQYNTKKKYKGILTRDGIHMNDDGNRFIARQILNTISEEFDGQGRNTKAAGATYSRVRS